MSYSYSSLKQETINTLYQVINLLETDNLKGLESMLGDVYSGFDDSTGDPLSEVRYIKFKNDFTDDADLGMIINHLTCLIGYHYSNIQKGFNPYPNSIEDREGNRNE